MKRIDRHLVVTALVLLLPAAACSRANGRGAAAARPAVAVEVAPVVSGDLKESIEVVGTLTPKFQAEVKTEYSGTVTDVLVTEWVRVSKGTILLRFDVREYQVRLAKGGETAVFPPRPAVTRFKGDVSTVILVPHVLCMFLGMLFSTAAGLAALAGAPTRRLALVTFALIAVGGFILGPIVQKAAFDAYWTGVPFGWDLTDNKTLIAGLFWAGAILVQRPGRTARIEILAAAVTTLLIFAIPHSTWGSEIKWEAVQKAP